MPRAWPTALWPFGTPQLMSRAVRRQGKAEGMGCRRGLWVGVARRAGRERGRVLGKPQGTDQAVVRNRQGVLPPPLPPTAARP